MLLLSRGCALFLAACLTLVWFDSAALGQAADANDDGQIDVSDPITTLLFLFSGGSGLIEGFVTVRFGGAQMVDVGPFANDGPMTIW